MLIIHYASTFVFRIVCTSCNTHHFKLVNFVLLCLDFTTFISVMLYTDLFTVSTHIFISINEQFLIDITIT